MLFQLALLRHQMSTRRMQLHSTICLSTNQLIFPDGVTIDMVVPFKPLNSIPDSMLKLTLGAEPATAQDSMLIPWFALVVLLV